MPDHYLPGPAHMTRPDPVCASVSFGASPCALFRERAGILRGSPCCSGICGGRRAVRPERRPMNTCKYIYVYTYVPSRVPSRSFKRLCIHVCTWPSAQPLFHAPMHTHRYLPECPAALSDAQPLFWDAHLLSRMPIRSFTRDVTRPERRPMPWLGSG